jgi:hypothetical protein
MIRLTELEAVNRILRASMEHPVASLEESGINEPLTAKQVLDEVNMREQMDGWHINTLIVELEPDGSNRIALPANTLVVVGEKENQFDNLSTTVIGGVVYLLDVKEGTHNEFEENVHLRLTTLIPFDELPPQYQFSIADQAAVEYQQANHGSQSVDAQLTSRAARSRARQRRHDARLRPSNQFNNSRSQIRRGRLVPRNWPWRG